MPRITKKTAEATAKPSEAKTAESGLINRSSADYNNIQSRRPSFADLGTAISTPQIRVFIQGQEVTNWVKSVSWGYAPSDTGKCSVSLKSPPIPTKARHTTAQTFPLWCLRYENLALGESGEEEWATGFMDPQTSEEIKHRLYQFKVANNIPKDADRHRKVTIKQLKERAYQKAVEKIREDKKDPNYTLTAKEEADARALSKTATQIQLGRNLMDDVKEAKNFKRWDMGVGTCVFHKHDTIRVFTRIPWLQGSSKDEMWLPVFNGYVNSVEYSLGEGSSDLSLSCFDIRGIMQKMSIAQNSLATVKAYGQRIEQFNSLFDEAYLTKFRFELLAGRNLHEAVRLIIYGDASVLETQTQTADGASRVLNGLSADQLANLEAEKAYKGVGFFKPKNFHQYALKIASAEENIKSMGDPEYRGSTLGKLYYTQATKPITVETAPQNIVTTFEEYYKHILHGVTKKALTEDEVTELGVNSYWDAENCAHGENMGVILFMPDPASDPFQRTLSANLIKVIKAYLSGGTIEDEKGNVHEATIEDYQKALTSDGGLFVERLSLFKLDPTGGNQNTTFDFKTRLDIIESALKALDFKFWITGSGDMVIEPPMYDVTPGCFGSLADNFVVDRYQKSFSVSQDASDIPNVITVIGGPRNHTSKANTTEGMGPQVSILRIPELVARYGIIHETVEFHTMETETRLKYAAIYVQQKIMEATAVSMSDVPYMPILPNKPIYLKNIDVLACVTGVDVNYEAGSASIRVSPHLNSVRRRGADNSFIYVSGSSYSPFSFFKGYAPSIADTMAQAVRDLNTTKTNKFGPTVAPSTEKLPALTSMEALELSIIQSEPNIYSDDSADEPVQAKPGDGISIIDDIIHVMSGIQTARQTEAKHLVADITDLSVPSEYRHSYESNDGVVDGSTQYAGAYTKAELVARLEKVNEFLIPTCKYIDKRGGLVYLPKDKCTLDYAKSLDAQAAAATDPNKTKDNCFSLLSGFGGFNLPNLNLPDINFKFSLSGLKLPRLNLPKFPLLGLGLLGLGFKGQGGGLFGNFKIKNPFEFGLKIGMPHINFNLPPFPKININLGAIGLRIKKMSDCLGAGSLKKFGANISAGLKKIEDIDNAVTSASSGEPSAILAAGKKLGTSLAGSSTKTNKATGWEDTDTGTLVTTLPTAETTSTQKILIAEVTTPMQTTGEGVTINGVVYTEMQGYAISGPGDVVDKLANKLVPYWNSINTTPYTVTFKNNEGKTTIGNLKLTLS